MLLIPIAVGEVAARNLGDAMHFPIGQAVPFDKLRSFEHRFFFRGLV